MDLPHYGFDENDLLRLSSTFWRLFSSSDRPCLK